MNIFFGVNSNIPLNSKTKNGYTIYDWVVRKKGIPAFCFRTLCGENSTTREEIDYLSSSQDIQNNNNDKENTNNKNKGIKKNKSISKKKTYENKNNNIKIQDYLD